MTALSETEIRKAVKERYTKLATSKGESCCSPSETKDFGVPDEATSISDGSGEPLQLIKPREGDTVLDLGSGGGADVFHASRLVGTTGRVIGVDATPEMIWRARDTAQKHGYTNVEFRLGEIEHLPVESNSVDYVISNCVINLAPDKGLVLQEAYRVLKPSGRLAISDIAVEDGVGVERDLDNWCACEGGAITVSKYKELLASSGFQDIETKTTSRDGHSVSHHDIYVTATKPA
ncbi:MAG: arsenite S-adenosylmethyltransferase [Acidobacteria bacterium]|nr:MAG: arsenite S-adenosylmethyltransferase [Acidobacteriota bacterium]